MFRKIKDYVKLRRLKSQLIELDWDREFSGVPKADVWFKEHNDLKNEIQKLEEQINGKSGNT